MLEVILDTETTGLSVQQSHRIVEIGCIEINNHIPTNIHNIPEFRNSLLYATKPLLKNLFQLMTFNE